jgi:hypothetical protein
MDMGIYAFLFLVGMEGTSGVFMLGYISYPSSRRFSLEGYVGRDESRLNRLIG